MRLIDADKYLEKVCLYKGTGCGSCRLQLVCPKDTPTVEAIPIEWLKKHGWYGVIEHWEKDQKLNNSKEVLYSLLKDHGFNSYEEYINWAATIMAVPRDDRVKFLEEERKKCD